MPDYASPQQIKQTAATVFPLELRDDRIQAFFGADPFFYLPTLQQMQEFLHYNVNLPPVDLGTGFDCDDYAYAVKGSIGLWNRNHAHVQASWCVGVIFARFAWMGNVEHAANWFIDKAGLLHLIEPQTRQHYPPGAIAPKSIKLLLM